MPYEGLEFGYNATLQELQTFSQTVAPFLEEGDKRVMALVGALKQSFRFYRKDPGDRPPRVVKWAIPENVPIKTKLSKGEYERGDKRQGAHHVYGEVSGLWQIQPIFARKKASALLLTGNASIRSRVVDATDGTVLAQWKSEIGVGDSPGCHFHMAAGQELDKEDVVTGGDLQFSLFPKSLSVPRMPGVLITFVDAIDFLLGELFQARWTSRAAGQGAEVWGSHQRKRLLQLLRWQTSLLEMRSTGSAWQFLKTKRPNDRTLLSG